MQINGVPQAASGAKPAVPSNQLNGDAFMKLLVAQLKAQDPFEPLKPTEFMGQLVQFNTLDQLIRIRKAVEPAGGA
ncbi:MAG: hypothetical protein HY234_08170 [Acidobacteria bacterium]|nr:hypothetical protein [Acidobacteriota bacterium]MBI3663007.1 hypothetical protein [Acidobacteriota bacterium]